MISRPIQVIPSGLLGFLQLKNNGQNPQDLPDVLQPVLELRDWYLQSRAEEIVTPTNIPSMALPTATFGFQTFTTNPTVPVVPDKEWWYVHDIAIVTTFVPAADFIGGAIGWVSPNTAGNTKLVSIVQNFPGAANIVGAWRNDRSFFVPSGAIFGFFPTQNTRAAGNLTISLTTLRATRLPI